MEHLDHFIWNDWLYQLYYFIWDRTTIFYFSYSTFIVFPDIGIQLYNKKNTSAKRAMTRFRVMLSTREFLPNMTQIYCLFQIDDIL